MLVREGQVLVHDDLVFYRPQTPEACLSVSSPVPVRRLQRPCRVGHPSDQSAKRDMLDLVAGLVEYVIGEADHAERAHPTSCVRQFLRGSGLEHGFETPFDHFQQSGRPTFTTDRRQDL